MTDTTDTLEIEVDEARKVMLDSISDEIGMALVHEDLREVVNQRIVQLYDNREQLGDQLGAQVQTVEVDN